MKKFGLLAMVGMVMAATMAVQAGVVFTDNFTGTAPDHAWGAYGTIPGIAYTIDMDRTVGVNPNPNQQNIAYLSDKYGPVNVADGEFKIEATVAFNPADSYVLTQVHLARSGNQPIVPGEIAWIQFQPHWWGYQLLFVHRYINVAGDTEAIVNASSSPNSINLGPGGTYETVTITRSTSGVWTVTGSQVGPILTATESTVATGSHLAYVEIRNTNESGITGVWWDSLQFSQTVPKTNLTGHVVLSGYNPTDRSVPVALRVGLRSGGTETAYTAILVWNSGTSRWDFSIPVDKGIYDIAIKGSAWLQTVLPSQDVTADNNVDIGPITLIAGDVDGNNAVDSTDLSVILANLDAFGSL